MMFFSHFLFSCVSLIPRSQHNKSASTGLYQPWMVDVGECGAISGMIGREIRNTRSTIASEPLSPPQISHDLIRARTRATNRPRYGTAVMFSRDMTGTQRGFKYGCEDRHFCLFG
jgi:hypothetical protein